MKSRIFLKLAQFNVILTIIWVLLFAWVSILGQGQFLTSIKAVDIPLFIIMWTYVFITPVIGLLVLILCDRKLLAIRANYIALFFWIIFIAWVGTISF
jgi:hypothetical protein